MCGRKTKAPTCTFCCLYAAACHQTFPPLESPRSSIEYQKLEVQHQLLYAEEDRVTVPISPPDTRTCSLPSRRTRGIPTPPPAPAPAVLPDLWSAKAHPLKEELPGVANELLTRPKGSTSLPPAVQQEAVKAAKDMSKAISKKNPPLARLLLRPRW